MFIDHLLTNLNWYIPAAVTLIVGTFVIRKKKYSKRILLWGNLGLLIILVLSSIPPTDPLKAEIAFYALREKSNTTYDLINLLGETETPPKYLGLKDSLGHVKGLPTAHSGDGLQIRLKLNRKAHLYIFHFDTTAMTLQQLFPTMANAITNPIRSDIWIELPASKVTWPLDVKPDLEAFILFADISERNDVQAILNNCLERIKAQKTDSVSLIQNIEQEFSTLGSCFYVTSGKLNHGLQSVSPTVVKTRTFKGKEDKSILFCQFVQHK